VADTWRALEDPGSTVASDDRVAPVAESGPGRPLWPILGLAAAVVLGAAAWMVVTGPSGGDVTVGNARSAALGVTLAATTGPAASGGADPSVQPTTAATLVVDVNGAVRRPGVYHLAPDARVGDAIAAAGGYGPRVDASATQALNLAARLTDGQQVHVPARGEQRGGDPSRSATQGALTTEGSQSGGPINVNTATAAQLEALPGIGPVTSAKIIAARAERPFGSVDELRERKMIGQATLEKIRDLAVAH